MNIGIPKCLRAVGYVLQLWLEGVSPVSTGENCFLLCGLECGAPGHGAENHALRDRPQDEGGNLPDRGDETVGGFASQWARALCVGAVHSYEVILAPSKEL